MSHVKLISETHDCLYMPQEHEIYGVFFTVFLQVFAENIYKIYFTGNESNELRLRQ